MKFAHVRLAQFPQSVKLTQDDDVYQTNQQNYYFI